jgi:hypothetical protein
MLLKWILYIGCGSMDWIILDEVRDQWRALVNTLNEPWGFIKVGEFLSSCTTGSFLTRTQLFDVN